MTTTDITTTEDITTADVSGTGIVARYVAMWNEPDQQVRRGAVAALFSADAEHKVLAPEELRAPAHALGFPDLVMRVRGHRELEFRVTQAYTEFVGSGSYRFRARGDVARLDSMLKFGWEMIAADGTVAASGTDVVMLDVDGRIRSDHQFVER